MEKVEQLKSEIEQIKLDIHNLKQKLQVKKDELKVAKKKMSAGSTKHPPAVEKTEEILQHSFDIRKYEMERLLLFDQLRASVSSQTAEQDEDTSLLHDCNCCQATKIEEVFTCKSCQQPICGPCMNRRQCHLCNGRESCPRRKITPEETPKQAAVPPLKPVRRRSMAETPEPPSPSWVKGPHKTPRKRKTTNSVVLGDQKLSSPQALTSSPTTTISSVSTSEEASPSLPPQQEEEPDLFYGTDSDREDKDLFTPSSSPPASPLSPKKSFGFAYAMPDLGYSEVPPSRKTSFSFNFTGTDDEEDEDDLILPGDDETGDETGDLVSYPPKSSKKEKSSFGDFQLSGSADQQWSNRFQQCLQRLQELKDETEQEKRVQANTELMHLSEDFVAASRAIGKMIISEVYLPLEDKVIKPITGGIGGCAGGEKYIVHNILFKFALDVFGLFGGSDLSASKVAGHELKGLMTYFSALRGVHFPLMTLVDYRGFRLVAMSVLPVGKDTLIYGTSDAGASYHYDEEFGKKMSEAATALNLQTHLCGSSSSLLYRLSSAADIEGHCGRDGNFYLLDFSRTMPPVTPQAELYFAGHLYNLFRPEFVRKSPTPLCPDAFSGFVIHDPEAKSYNKDIEVATIRLKQRVIPQYCRALMNRQLELKDLKLFMMNLTAHMHKAGINIRYIGLVVSFYWQLGESKLDKVLGKSELLPYFVRIYLIEAIARVIKNELSLLMRQKTKDLKLILEVPYRKLAVDFMNKIFGRGDTPDHWWSTILPPLLKLHFSLDDQKIPPDFRLHILTQMPQFDPRLALFQRIVSLTGLVFSENIIQKFEDRTFFTSEPFDSLDLVEIGDRVKCMDIVSFSQGNFFLYKALSQTDSRLKESLLLQAIRKYEEALKSNSNTETLMNCSIAHYNILILRFNPLTSFASLPNTSSSVTITKQKKEEIGEQTVFISFDPTDPSVQKARDCLRHLISTDPTNSKSLCLYAMFLNRCDEFADAEEFFLKSIQIEPSNSFAIVEYMHFLDRCGQHQTADYALEVITSKTKHKLISPYTGKELGGIVRVFLQNGSFKSLSIRATMTTKDVLVLICHSLKIPFNSMDMQLIAVDLGEKVSKEALKSGPIWSKVVAGAKRQDLLSETALPWFYPQRHNCHFFLYFRPCPSPVSCEKIFTFLSSTWRGPVDESINSLEELVGHLLRANHGFVHCLLFISPLLVLKEELKQILMKGEPFGENHVRVLETWTTCFDDLEVDEIAPLAKKFPKDFSFCFDIMTRRKALVNEEKSAQSNLTARFKQLSQKMSGAPTRSVTPLSSSGPSIPSTTPLTSSNSSPLVPSSNAPQLSSQRQNRNASPPPQTKPSSPRSTSPNQRNKTRHPSPPPTNVRQFQMKHRKTSPPPNRHTSTPCVGHPADFRRTGSFGRDPVPSSSTPTTLGKSASPKKSRPKSIVPPNFKATMTMTGSGGFVVRNAFSKPFSFILRDEKPEDLTKVAEQLRLWVMTIQSNIQPQDFLSFSRQCRDRDLPESISLGLLYEQCISEWVMNEVADEDATSPTISKFEPSLRSFEAFVDLAARSYQIGDLSTAIAIVDALNSDPVTQLHPNWTQSCLHRTIRCKFFSSSPFLHFALSSSMTTEEYFQNYLEAITLFDKSKMVCLPNITRVMLFVRSIGPIVMEHLSGPKLPLSTANIFYSVVSKFAIPSLGRSFNFLTFVTLRKLEILRQHFDEEIFSKLSQDIMKPLISSWNLDKENPKVETSSQLLMKSHHQTKERLTSCSVSDVQRKKKAKPLEGYHKSQNISKGKFRATKTTQLASTLNIEDL